MYCTVGCTIHYIPYNSRKLSCSFFFAWFFILEKRACMGQRCVALRCVALRCSSYTRVYSNQQQPAATAATAEGGEYTYIVERGRQG